MRQERAYYIWLALGIVALLIFFLTCIRPVQAIGFDNGFQAFLYDGRMQHKLGELFLWIPFFYLGWSTYWKNQIDLAQSIERYRWIMLLGGLLNLLSWFSLRHEVWWHPFCWVVFFWGLFAVPLSRYLFLDRAEQ